MCESEWSVVGMTSEKLALNSNLCPKMLKIAREALLKFGKLSSPYLRRKLKCTHSIACDIMKELTLET